MSHLDNPISSALARRRQDRARKRSRRLLKTGLAASVEALALLSLTDGMSPRRRRRLAALAAAAYVRDRFRRRAVREA